MADRYDDIKGWDLTGLTAVDAPKAPPPSAKWRLLDKGTAWVYYADGNSKLTKPVILSDGFHADGTDLDVMFHGLNGGAYPFITELRRHGYDLVILGYDDCTASMLSNAEVARACINEALAKRDGAFPLAVGGFSMGGIITRYILAKMEQEAKRGGKGHGADTYICYDSPHLGAWIPIALQALALSLPASDATHKMIVSDAARQLLWQHLPELEGEPGMDRLRTEFLAKLAEVGNWPMAVHKIGVANGKGEGTNGIRPGLVAVSADGILLKNVKLFTQGAGDEVLVAQVGAQGDTLQKTSGMPEADGAHGGKLNGFKLAADALKKVVPLGTVCNVEDHGFVPTGSAIAVTGMDPWTNLSAGVLHAPSALNEIKCASQNEAHTLMTKELGSFILSRLDRRLK
jgi:hypothetical protein